MKMLIKLIGNLRPTPYALRTNSGQAMLITVIVLSGTLLSATTIAGLLMLYQLRQSSDIANSTKAIMAADAGLEWRMYKFLKADSGACKDDCNDGGKQCPAPTLANGATFKTTCVSNKSNSVETVIIRSTGFSEKNARALEITFTRNL